MRSKLAGVLVGSLFCMSANATVIFQDNFDSEAGAPGQSSLNYNSFTNWTVSDGTVDVVSNGGWGINCVGNTGKCVDLDGSSGNAGIFTSTALTLTAGEYLLSFDISGNQRGGAADNLLVTLGGFFNDSFSLSPLDPWVTVTHSFTVSSTSSNSFIFNHAGGDNVGIMLDNVSLVRAVPEPATIAMFGLGLLGVGFARKKVK